MNEGLIRSSFRFTHPAGFKLELSVHPGFIKNPSAPSSPPLPSSSGRSISGQPFHRLRQPDRTIAAQLHVNIFQRADQVNHLPPG